VIGRKAARRWRDRETKSRTEGGKMQRCEMKVKIIESMQSRTQSTIERDRKPVVVVVWSEGEGRRDKAAGSIESEDDLV
jgi:hypothetical protein